MRTFGRFFTLAAALLVATGLAGCRDLEREIEAHFALAQKQEVEVERPARVYRSRPRISSAHRLAKPEVVPAGERLRQYCGKRHIQFQKGTLHENDAEKMRNNELCRQVYKA